MNNESAKILRQNGAGKRNSLATDDEVILSRLSSYRLLGYCLSAVKCPSAEGVLTRCQLLQADRSEEEWAVISSRRKQRMARLNHSYAEK